jgi:alpha-tubulin suppressor-like RCC1 family protein
MVRLVSWAHSQGTGAGHTLLFTAAGELFAFGDNKAGQCGVGRKTDTLLTPAKVGLADVVAVSAARDFSVAVTSAGRVFGPPPAVYILFTPR